MYVLRGGNRPLPQDPSEAQGVVLECIEMLCALRGRCSKPIWARIDLVAGDLFDILDAMIQEAGEAD